MKIAIAQTRPVKGDIAKNILAHKKLTELALSERAGMIIFPELSLSGYEPELAKQLATDQDDARLDELQKISDDNSITIGAGLPVKTSNGVCIGMVIFQPHQSRQTYLKKYLHSSEENFFVPGENFTGLLGEKKNIAIAICYELSVPEHSQTAFEKGAQIYVASVVETVPGIEKASRNLSAIAKKYRMAILMSNCAGRTGLYDCGGRSSVWNDKGELVGQLDDVNEGIIVFDPETEQLVCKIKQDGEMITER
jgi:predicted amidohydrolase